MGKIVPSRKRGIVETLTITKYLSFLDHLTLPLFIRRHRILFIFYTNSSDTICRYCKKERVLYFKGLLVCTNCINYYKTLVEWSKDCLLLKICPGPYEKFTKNLLVITTEPIATKLWWNGPLVQWLDRIYCIVFCIFFNSPKTLAEWC